MFYGPRSDFLRKLQFSVFDSDVIFDTALSIAKTKERFGVFPGNNKDTFLVNKKNGG